MEKIGIVGGNFPDPEVANPNSIPDPSLKCCQKFLLLSSGPNIPRCCVPKMRLEWVEVKTPTNTIWGIENIYFFTIW